MGYRNHGLGNEIRINSILNKLPTITYQDCKKFKTNQVTEDIVFPTEVHYT